MRKIIAGVLLLLASNASAIDITGSGSGCTTDCTFDSVTAADITATDDLTVGDAATVVGTTTLIGNVTASGNLGIGTASPGAKFEVVGGSASIRKAASSTQLTLSGGSPLDTSNESGGIQFGDSCVYGGRIFSRNYDAALYVQGCYNDSSNKINFDTRAGGTAVRSMVVMSSGVWAAALTQNTARSCTTGTTTDADGKFDGCVASDRRAKEGISVLPYDAKAIDLLRPVNYRLKKDPKRQRIGFIAQDVEKVSGPAVVPAGAGDLKGLDSNALIALLVQEVQALRKRVAELEKKK